MDPYHIWVSEIILQQTRIDQGLDYYHEFIRRFPDVRKLAESSEEEVLKVWQGLGYYSRARNMHRTAAEIVNHYGGIFPEDYETLLGLSGIGPYTAAAVMSIAFGRAYPTVDGNVLRVLSRYLALEESVDDALIKKKIMLFLQEHISREQPGDFNQGLMELGAIICKPRNPLCSECPLKDSCRAFAMNKTDMFPVKGSRTAVKRRYLHYLVILLDDRGVQYIYMNKRKQDDIWKGLYDFPLIETAQTAGITDLEKTEAWDRLFSSRQPHIWEVSPEFSHKLTHREIIARFYEIAITKPLPRRAGMIKVTLDQVSKYPVPRLIDRYLKYRGQ